MATVSPPGTMASRIAERRQNRALVREASRDELGDLRERIQAEYWERVEAENAAHRERLTNSRSAIDDNTEDDATGEARARLRAESAARRTAALERQKLLNKKFFAHIRTAKSAIDTKIWDDGVGSAVRVDAPEC